eukprot:gene31493-6680_t
MKNSSQHWLAAGFESAQLRLAFCTRTCPLTPTYPSDPSSRALALGPTPNLTAPLSVSRHAMLALLASLSLLLLPSPALSRWDPSPGDNFYYQLGRLIKKIPRDLQPASAQVKAYVVDGFDTKASVVAQMLEEGLYPVCYFSAGSSENWRSDFEEFPKSALGKNLDGWAGEKWLDHRNTEIRQIMKQRMEMCKEKGFPAVHPDNVDGYTNPTGFPLTAEDQLDYNRFLAATAHSLDLSIGLKNDVGQLAELVGDFDFAVNEQCWQYNECQGYELFVQAGKAVWNIEYNMGLNKVCPKAAALGIKTVKQRLNLDKWRKPCPNA